MLVFKNPKYFTRLVLLHSKKKNTNQIYLIHFYCWHIRGLRSKPLIIQVFVYGQDVISLKSIVPDFFCV